MIWSFFNLKSTKTTDIVPPMKALVTGGTGLVGRELLTNLHDAVVLSREPSLALGKPGVGRAVRWNPMTEPAPSEAAQGIDVVFHLAGESIAEGRWTEEKKRLIRDSRVVGTRNLVAGLRALDRKPAVLVSASAVGFYGDRGDGELDESSPVGKGYLPEVCAAWEREALAAEELGIRVVCARIGIVLASNGGALSRMVTPFKFGAGGRLGNGKQWMPWVHINDVASLLLHASRTASIRGAMNAVSPFPVTNAEFTRSLAQAVHRPAFLPIPKTALRLAFGELSQVLLSSQRVLPRVAERTGFRFRFSKLQSALLAMMPGPQRTAA